MAMKFDGEHWSADSKSDFSGWELLHIEDFKDGVKRVHVRTIARAPYEFRMVYCRDEHVPTEFKPNVCA